MLETLLTFFAVGLVTLIAVGVALFLIGLVLSILGTVFSLAFGMSSLLLFRVAPLVFFGWIVLKLVERRRSLAVTPPAIEERNRDAE